MGSALPKHPVELVLVNALDVRGLPVLVVDEPPRRGRRHLADHLGLHADLGEGCKQAPNSGGVHHYEEAATAEQPEWVDTEGVAYLPRLGGDVDTALGDLEPEA